MGLATGSSVNIAFLAAVFISNLPEGMAGSLNLQSAGYSRRSILWLWIALVLVSAACAGLGYALLRWLPTIDGGPAQAFAAGAMLTMLADASAARYVPGRDQGRLLARHAARHTGAAPPDVGVPHGLEVGFEDHTRRRVAHSRRGVVWYGGHLYVADEPEFILHVPKQHD